MCGRFERTLNVDQIMDRFGIQLKLPDLKSPAYLPSYNVAPTQQIPAIIAPDGTRALVNFKWGLVPGWAKNLKMAPINARDDTVASNNLFRNAFKHRRCLIPANGFYEWQKLGPKEKQPFHIGLPEFAPFAFAGLWEEQTREDGVLRTCTIVTTSANETVRPIHNRMPVILTPDVEELWLDPSNEDTEELLALLRPYPEPMEAYPVGSEVGNVKNNHAGLLNSL